MNHVTNTTRYKMEKIFENDFVMSQLIKDELFGADIALGLKIGITPEEITRIYYEYVDEVGVQRIKHGENYYREFKRWRD